MPIQKEQWGLLGTGIHHGQPKSGVEKGLGLLRDRGVIQRLIERGAQINDHGDLASMPNSKPYETLFRKSKELLKLSETPLWVGGDHSQAFATISALLDLYPQLKVIWVDAHGDINTPATSPTGNLHGMPLSGLLGLAPKEDFQMPWLNQNLIPKQVALIGIRDLDKNEMELIRNNGVLHFTSEDVEKMGMPSVMKSIQTAWGSTGPVHLSFDIDGMDSSLVPATGTPVASGLTMDDMDALVSHAKSFFELVSCEIVELNPDLAKHTQDLDRTVETVEHLLKQIIF